jgi:KaiC/GvpD/RAD55 family RecA-like ATPase
MPRVTRHAVKRIPTGIPGLDRLIQGGLVKGSTVLLSGATGTCKTIFCVQFLFEGLKKGENCMFITLEERPEDIMADVRAFGWNLEKYIKMGKLGLVYRDPFEITDIITPLIDQIRTKNIQRVAVDSTSLLGLYFKDDFDVRKQLFKLIMALKKAGVTALLTAERLEESKALSRFGVEEYITDGVIVIYYTGIAGEEGWNLQIRKMRQTKHARGYFPLDVTNKGLVIKPEIKAVLMK